MILQALVEYYNRKAADPESNMAPEGFEWKEIPFLIVIDKDGKFVRFEDTREGEGKNRKAKSYLLPQGEKRAAGIKANFLWDGPGYLLGAKVKERNDSAERHTAFVTRMVRTLSSHRNNPAVDAVLKFLESEPLNQVESLAGESAIWMEILETSPFMTFRLEGSGLLATEIANIDLDMITEENAHEGLCLVSGERAQVTRIHPSIKGVWGGQPAGAALVSFQVNSGYDSFGKSQNFNAPIGKRSTFAYTMALNVLLAKESENRLQFGDASTVFWSQKSSSRFEKQVKSFFSTPRKEKDDPDKDVPDAKQTLSAVLIGIPPEEISSKFYILGLSPNAARISVRFWHSGTVGEFAKNLGQHLTDLDIVAPSFDKERMGLTYLLSSTVLDWKAENIPPNLAGAVMQAVLNNAPYPETLQHQCLRRIRAERKVERIRAAILKACLNRKLRRSSLTNQKEITVSLDLTNLDPGYRLGRLFAVLEKIQEDANPGLNATIRDRFYGAASSNPVAVFPQLLKLKNHHLAKLSNRGQAVNHEKLLAEIFGGIEPEMPAHLAMDEQARFAIGYYHQRQALFTKNDSSEGEKK